jgi:hypothetical protein
MSALAAFTAGLQTGHSVALLKLPLLQESRRVGHIILCGCLALVWVARVFMAVVEQVVRLVAWPAVTILRLARLRRETVSRHARVA